MDVLVNFSLLGLQAGVEFPHLTPTYLDNLCRLGLAEIPEMFEYTAKGIYEPLEKAQEVLIAKTNIEANPKWRAEIQHKGLRITELGKQFANVCVLRKS